MVGVLHSYARGLAGAASSMWQTAWGQRDEDHEYGITAHGYDDDNDAVQGDAVNVNDPSSVCVFSALRVDALSPFMTISLLVSARSREEGARILPRGSWTTQRQTNRTPSPSTTSTTRVAPP